MAEDIDSGDSADEEAATHAEIMAAEAYADETADERRVRLAKEMLGAMDVAQRRITADAGEGGGDADMVGEQLEEDALRLAGRWRHQIAASLREHNVPASEVRVLRGVRLSPTCVGLTADETAAYCGCKDGSITRWDLATGQRMQMRHEAAAEQGHRGSVLALALSGDGRVLASAGHDSRVLLWDARTHHLLKELKGHRKGVNALATRRDIPDAELYSGSADRCGRVWNLEQQAFVETLFGHQEGITALDAMGAHTLVSGSEDRSVRLWKVAEEAQLLFTGHSAAVDAITMLTASAFVSGSQDGHICLWSETRKKALATARRAHGPSPFGGPSWISALASPPLSDLAISGSCDGNIRFWHCDDGARTIEQVMQVPVLGFVNGLAVAPTGRFVAAAVGQEHRLGRWFRQKEARNSLVIVPLPPEIHRKPHLLAQHSARLQNGGGSDDDDGDSDGGHGDSD